MSNPYATAEYRRNRAIILQGNPDCTICGGPDADSADHIIPIMAGGDNSLDNMRPAHTKCNSRRGASDQSRAAARKRQTRNAGTKRNNPNANGFFSTTPLTPTPLNSQTFLVDQPELAETGRDQRRPIETGSELPRLETCGVGVSPWADLVAQWARTYLQTELFPWQVHALAGTLMIDDDGNFVHREALVSTARQNGKSVALSALIGWALTELPKIWGRPVNILSTANRLDRAEAIYLTLSPILKEIFGAKLTQVPGRKGAKIGNSEWHVRAANINLHGGSYDLVVADEIFDISSEVLDTAIRPTMIARQSPLFSAWSTAGDASSDAMITMREEALTAIDAGENRGLYFAEWSAEPGQIGPETWGMANPALGRTITIKALEAASRKDYFLRAHLNQWVTARGAWLKANEWEACKTKVEMPTGGWLAIDSSIDESRYVGIRAAQIDKQVMVQVAFVADSEEELWEHVGGVLMDPKVQLLVTPSLEIHIPVNLQRRYKLTGYAELLRYTSLVQKMILEGRVLHDGSTALHEHMTRATMVKTAQGAVLSSQKSPGPIELARCAVWAIAEVSRPMTRSKPMLVVSG